MTSIRKKRCTSTIACVLAGSVPRVYTRNGAVTRQTLGVTLNLCMRRRYYLGGKGTWYHTSRFVFLIPREAYTVTPHRKFDRSEMKKKRLSQRQGSLSIEEAHLDAPRPRQPARRERVLVGNLYPRGGGASRIGKPLHLYGGCSGESTKARGEKRDGRWGGEGKPGEAYLYPYKDPAPMKRPGCFFTKNVTITVSCEYDRLTG